jgi:glycosyltransferase involved in cell wall biosynthesis
MAVGRLEWQKGFDRLIDSWHLVINRHPDWRLDIFGSGSLQQQLDDQILRLGLSASVSIHPFTPEINQEYALSQIFALTSRFEGFGLVLLEAMLHGLPCVVMDCPYGPSDVVVHGRTGYVVPDDDIHHFAQCLDELMENTELRMRFSLASKERVKAYEADTVMACWKDLFEDITGHAS